MGRALWNVRKRHEWLRKARKKTRVKRRTKARCGLLAAEQRRAAALAADAAPTGGEHGQG